jgi:predicted RNase H-like nuclease (RuvC/YqgF family)
MPSSAPSARRSTTVFGIAVSELFILLLFLVILLWIATTPAKSDTADLRIAALEAKIKELDGEVKKLRTENTRLKSDLEQRDFLISLLWKLYEKKPITLSPNPEVRRKQIDVAVAEAKKREESGGRGHANCLGKGSGALFRLTINDEGVSVQSIGEAANEKISQIPAAFTLVTARVVSVQKFDELSSSILKWSNAQKPTCRFDVTFVDKTTTKVTYRAAEKAMDKSFYKREVDG